MQRRYIFFILALALGINAQAQSINGKTFYYKQIHKVVNGQKSNDDNGGQFIYFTEKGCYDADKNGYTVNNGFLTYKGNGNGYQTYYGNSFWGTATYYFLNDYSRLNIVLETTNITYVYVRTTPPANVITCTLIKKNETYPSPNPVNPPVVNPIERTKTEKTLTAKQKYVTREESCPQCHNSGNCSSCNGRGYVISTYTQKYDDCVNCTNGKCTKCGGTGKILKGRYETVYE